jgi:hypothetical protein
LLRLGVFKAYAAAKRELAMPMACEERAAHATHDKM